MHSSRMACSNPTIGPVDYQTWKLRMTEANGDHSRLIYPPRGPDALASGYSALLTGWLAFHGLGLRCLYPFSAPSKSF